jgi:nitroreductase
MTSHVNKISSIIFHRKSSKAYQEQKEIPLEDLLSFFEAARWAPSARNKQPWRYILFSENFVESINKMRSCLDEKNQIWANKAPVLILACAEIADENGKPNPVALHDLGLANENLLLQIRSLGYNCRPMGGFDKEKARLLFGLPDNIKPVITVAVGYPKKLSTLPEDILEEEKRPRVRNEIQSWVHINEWGKLDLNNHSISLHGGD